MRSQFQGISHDNTLLSILYKGEALCTAVNEDISNRIQIMAQKLPPDLEISYSYSVYESKSNNTSY